VGAPHRDGDVSRIACAPDISQRAFRASKRTRSLRSVGWWRQQHRAAVAGVNVLRSSDLGISETEGVNRRCRRGRRVAGDGIRAMKKKKRGAGRRLSWWREQHRAARSVSRALSRASHGAHHPYRARFSRAAYSAHSAPASKKISVSAGRYQRHRMTGSVVGGSAAAC